MPLKLHLIKYQHRHENPLQQICREIVQRVGKWIFRKMAKSTLAFYTRCRMDSLKSRKKTLQLSTVALQPAACNFRPATCDLQPSNCNLRTADWNLLPSTPPRAGRVRKALDCLQLARGERKKPTHRFSVLMFETFQLAINENLKSAMTPQE